MWPVSLRKLGLFKRARSRPSGPIILSSSHQSVSAHRPLLPRAEPVTVVRRPLYISSCFPQPSPAVVCIFVCPSFHLSIYSPYSTPSVEYHLTLWSNDFTGIDIKDFSILSTSAIARPSYQQCLTPGSAHPPNSMAHLRWVVIPVSYTRLIFTWYPEHCLTSSACSQRKLEPMVPIW